MLDEQVGVQLNLRGELFLADVSPLVVDVMLGDLFFQFAVGEYLHHVRASEQVPLDHAIDYDEIRVFIPCFVILAHVYAAIDIIFFLPYVSLWLIWHVEVFIKFNFLTSVFFPH